MKTISLALLILISAHAAATAGVEQEWVARFNGTGDWNDVAYAMALDASGNVYVTGTASATFGSDWGTIKYDPAGHQEWLRILNGGTHDVAFAIITDASGNVYVTGSSQGFAADYMTAKYSTAGDLLWVQFYEGPVFEEDSASSVALDPDGNVYVTGYSTGDGTSYDYATIKYSSDGVEQWVRRYNAPGSGEDVASAVACDASGVYVTGRSNFDYTTIKYDFSGAQQWLRSYNGPGNSSDTPGPLKLDSRGHVYVTGMSMGSGTDFDYATVKYDAAGTELWVSRYNGPANRYDYASALAVDPEGNVYVTGNSFDDFATVKYDSTGTQLWVQRYNGPGGAGDNASSIALDGSGSGVYVAGLSYGTGVTLYDYASIAYDAAGTERWVQRYNGPGDFYDQPHALTVDQLGNVFVTGQSGGAGTGLDFATIKYSQVTAAVTGPADLPSTFGLQSSPNPFRHGASIRFSVPAGEDASMQPVRLAVYDVQGRQVAVIVDGVLEAGAHEAQFDGSMLASGIYYCELRSGSLVETSTMIRVK